MLVYLAECTGEIDADDAVAVDPVDPAHAAAAEGDALIVLC